MASKPKILLGTPTHDGKAYCLEYWVRNVRAIQKVTPCDVLLVDNSLDGAYARQIRKLGIKVLRSPAFDEPLKALGEARKKLFGYALKHGYDHLFSLEQDLFPPPDIVKYLLALRKTLKTDLAVAASPYLIKYLTLSEPPYQTIDQLTSVSMGQVYSERNKREVQSLVTALEMMKNKVGVCRVFAAGLGCALVDVPILKKIEVRYSQETHQPDDAFFYIDLKALEIPVYVDTRLIDKVFHISGNVHTVHGWWSMASSVRNRQPKRAAGQTGEIVKH